MRKSRLIQMISMFVFAFMVLGTGLYCLTSSIVTGGGVETSTEEENQTPKGRSSLLTDDEENVTTNGAIDLGVFDGLTDDDGNDVVYWISDSSYMSSSWSGSGTSSSPYLISSAEDLALLSYNIFSYSDTVSTYSGIYFKQTADIDLAGTDYNDSGLYWMPIGGFCSSGVSLSSSMYFFAGYYDGGGYTISNLSIFYSSSMDLGISGYRSKEGYGAGLFGQIIGEEGSEASVSNVVLEDCDITFVGDVGGIAGYVYYATISDCSVSGAITGSNAAGIVGYAWECEISGCVNSATVTGESASGGILGVGESQVNISNSYNSGAISGTSNVGGIAGTLMETSETTYYSGINACFNAGEINGTYNIGGIAGYTMGTEESWIVIQNTYNTGAVTGSSYCVGGIVGMEDVCSVVNNSYNIATIEGSYYVGGIVGQSGYDSDDVIPPEIHNCLNIGDVTATTTTHNVGGILGYLVSGIVDYCYYYATIISNTTTYTYGIGKQSSELYVAYYESSLATYMTDEEGFYADDFWNTDYPWDFDSTWRIVTGVNDGYPIFYWWFETYTVYPEDYWIWHSTGNTTFSGGSGTSSNPYRIKTATDLADLACAVFSGKTFTGVYFEQTADIDLSDHYWMPIGGHNLRGSSSNQFRGSYDGGGYEISGLNTYYGSLSSIYSYMGLFGCVYGYTGSSIYGINIVDSTIDGYSNIGGIVGYARGSSSSSYLTIHDCSSDVTILCEGRGYSGGIVGYAYFYVRVYDCSNSGQVSSTFSGGIVGYSRGYSATYMNSIYRCHNTGTISDVYAGAGAVGGIAGYSGYSKIYNCYNEGPVTYDTRFSVEMGGIVGYAGLSSYIYNCYNRGSVEGAYHVGGVVGFLSSSYIYNCFNVGDVKATTSSSSYYFIVGGILGYSNSGTVSNCYYGGCTITGYTTTYQKGIGYDSETDAEGEDAEGVTEYLATITTLAKTKSWFTNSELWDSSYDWDFAYVWTINANYNDGYPVLTSSMTDFLEYDEDGDFWYYLNGYLPQTYLGDSAPDGVYIGDEDDAYTIRLSATTYAYIFIYNKSVGDYAWTIVFDSTTNTSVSGYFEIEPVVWIVGYGSEKPTDMSTAVTEQVVTCGYVYSGNTSAGWSWGMSSVLQMQVETLALRMDLSLMDMYINSYFTFDSFDSSTGTSQSNVIDDDCGLYCTLSVASVDEIDALGGSYAATCTDFVAFLLSGGTTTTGGTYTSYWTRDLAAELDSSSTYYSETGNTYTYSGALNNGVYVTSGGTLSNSKLKNTMGARLCMSI